MSNKNNKKGSSLTTWILVLIMIAGLSLLLYPTFADWWNSMYASRAIATYSEKIANMDSSQLDEMWEEAVKYNAEEFEPNSALTNISDEQLERYNNTLDVSGDGVMAFVQIPKVRIELPIYHGTDDNVLQVAVGHLENTSLPIGGTSTHAVISGHRGLPSAKLFTDIDQLVEGDIFIIQTLGRTMTYEVDQIRVVLPTELSNLVIEENMDYCTLLTCTPYGINSHRLLVRGKRIENAVAEVYVPADATQIQPMFIAPFVGVPILIILLIYLLVSTSKRKRR